jgi:hypothetical protein
MNEIYKIWHRNQIPTQILYGSSQPLMLVGVSRGLVWLVSITSFENKRDSSPYYNISRQSTCGI